MLPDCSVASRIVSTTGKLVTSVYNGSAGSFVSLDEKRIDLPDDATQGAQLLRSDLGKVLTCWPTDTGINCADLDTNGGQWSRVFNLRNSHASRVSYFKLASREDGTSYASWVETDRNSQKASVWAARLRRPNASVPVWDTQKVYDSATSGSEDFSTYKVAAFDLALGPDTVRVSWALQTPGSKRPFSRVLGSAINDDNQPVWSASWRSPTEELKSGESSRTYTAFLSPSDESGRTYRSEDLTFFGNRGKASHATISKHTIPELFPNERYEQEIGSDSFRIFSTRRFGALLAWREYRVVTQGHSTELPATTWVARLPF